MKGKSFKLALKGFILLSILSIVGCASSNERFNREYARVWKETIKSEAWKLSLKKNQNRNTDDAVDFYASNEDVVAEDRSKRSTHIRFEEKYGKLVSKAYFKIIAEAEKSDERLRKEYERLYLKEAEKSSASDGENKTNLNLASKRYEAHKQMLEGLKSWNIMSDYGSNDLEFFQAEHKNHVTQMFESGQSEAAIMNYLVYKLADLYHFEQ